MDGIERLQQLLNNGIRVFRIVPVPEELYSRTLLGIFPDGAMEFAYPYSHRRGGSDYRKAREILEKIEGKQLRGTIEVETHELVMMNGETYQFLLPSIKYVQK